MVVLPHPSTTRLGWPRALVVAAFAALPLGWATAPAPSLAQQSGYGQTMGTSTQEQQIYNYDPSGRPGPASGGLNPANPLDLINKIRKGSAMDDATPPGDAVDQALKELEAQSRPQTGATGKPSGPSPQPLGTAAATP